MTHESQTEKAIGLYMAGETKRALAIFKTFRMGLTKAERRVLQIAHELHQNNHFYKQLGIDQKAMMAEANEIIERHWKRNN